jgi:DNA mismatch endonuclease (patch repair protein)
MASSDAARARMVATRRRDTPKELELRRLIHNQGLRFRVDAPPIRSSRKRADLVFRSAQVAVFVDGCFWHGCPDHYTTPKSNHAWWTQKIGSNRKRDTDAVHELTASGWIALRFWEHEDMALASSVVADAVRRRTRGPR